MTEKILIPLLWFSVISWALATTALGDHKSRDVVSAPFTELPYPICAPVVDSAELMFHLGYEIISETKDKVVMLHPRTGNLAFFEFKGAGACMVAVGNPEHKEGEAGT